MNTSVIWAAVIFVLVVILWLVMSYTGFKRMKYSSEEAFRAVTMCYDARRRTAEKMIKLFRNYSVGEEGTLEKVEQAVATADAAELPAEIIAAEITVMEVIEEMTGCAGNHPDFEASKRYRKLKEELELDDRNIATTIRIYNTIAKTYNEKVHGAMTRFAAKLCGFKEIPMI